jgi:chromosome segregation ATPase
VQPLTKSRSATFVEIDRLTTKLEQQRRVNEELQCQLSVAECVNRIEELKAKLSALGAQYDQLKDENISLENVYSNQSQKTSVADRVEADIKRTKEMHSEELRELKEMTRQLKDQREREMDEYRLLQKQQSKLEEKTKAVDVGNLTEAELQTKLEVKERRVEDLKQQIKDLSKTSIDKQRSRTAVYKQQREYEDLRSEAEILRERLEALHLADELA